MLDSLQINAMYKSSETTGFSMKDVLVFFFQFPLILLHIKWHKLSNYVKLVIAAVIVKSFLSKFGILASLCICTKVLILPKPHVKFFSRIPVVYPEGLNLKQILF